MSVLSFPMYNGKKLFVLPRDARGTYLNEQQTAKSYQLYCLFPDPIHGLQFFVIRHVTYLYWIFLPLYAAVNIMPALVIPRTKRLKTCARGNALLTAFPGSCVLSVALFVLRLYRAAHQDPAGGAGCRGKTKTEWRLPRHSVLCPDLLSTLLPPPSR